jgi:hypothetical protein
MINCSFALNVTQRENKQTDYVFFAEVASTNCRTMRIMWVVTRYNNENYSNTVRVLHFFGRLFCPALFETSISHSHISRTISDDRFCILFDNELFVQNLTPKRMQDLLVIKL